MSVLLDLIVDVVLIELLLVDLQHRVELQQFVRRAFLVRFLLVLYVVPGPLLPQGGPFSLLEAGFDYFPSSHGFPFRFLPVVVVLYMYLELVFLLLLGFPFFLIGRGHVTPLLEVHLPKEDILAVLYFLDVLLYFIELALELIGGVVDDVVDVVIDDKGLIF